MKIHIVFRDALPTGRTLTIKSQPAGADPAAAGLIHMYLSDPAARSGALLLSASLSYMQAMRLRNRLSDWLGANVNTGDRLWDDYSEGT